MPTPEWARPGHDPYESPAVGLEIIGRGEAARRSKTYLKDVEIATLLALIKGHAIRLAEALRRAHLREFGQRLDDDELRVEYPVIGEWERMHQEQVEHYASVEGFSVKQASGARDERERRSESSAGSERSSRKNGEKQNERWE